MLTESQNDGHAENSIPPLNYVLRGYKKISKYIKIERTQNASIGILCFKIVLGKALQTLHMGALPPVTGSWHV